jgi:hypothetical protein
MRNSNLHITIYKFIKIKVNEHDFIFSNRGQYYLLENDDKILMVVKRDKKLWIDSEIHRSISDFFNLPLFETDNLIIEAVKHGWNIDCNYINII